jgi:hypothetical protein
VIRELRAALILAGISLHAVVGSPLPRRVERSTWERPLAEEETRRWVAVLAGVGVQVAPETLSEGSFRAASAGLALRTLLVTPFEPLLRNTGTGQNWPLFSYPDRHPHRLIVEARRAGGEWELLFAPLDDAHAFLAPVLTYRRIRGVYDGQSEEAGGAWSRLSLWVARQVFAQKPEYDEAQLCFERLHTRAPGEAGEPLEVVERRHTRVFHR